MPIPAGAELKIYWNINSNLAINTLGLEVTGNPVFNQALADLIGPIVKSAFTNLLAAQFAPGNSLVRVGIRDLRADHLPEFRETAAAAPATGTGDSLPASVALCVTLRTATAGKSGRGRVYLSGFGEAVNAASGIATAPASAAAVAFIDNLRTSLPAQGVSLAVLTRPQPDVVITKTTTPVSGPVETRILSHQTAKSGLTHRVTIVESRNNTWETQRRRTNGRGALPTALDAVFKLGEGISVAPA